MNDDALRTTRTALHSVAEALLAGHQYRTAGTIRLHVVPGGFSTGPMSGSPSRLMVRGGELTVDGAAGTRTVALDRLSLGQIASKAGISCAPPAEVYRSTPASDDFRIELDPASVDVIHGALAVGDAALRLLAGHRNDPVGDPVLWPEHFDVSCSVPGATVGVSPGDEYLEAPYAYVVPDAPRTGAFWNQPFGAARSLVEGDDAESVLQFFVDGLSRVHD
jgi:hypothetical protein